MTTWFRLTLLCLAYAVSVTPPYSASRFDHLLPIVGCGIMVRSTHRIRIRRAHRFGCQKHAIFGRALDLGNLWSSAYIDCGQYWSTRLGESWATGTDRALASCRSGGNAGNSNQHPRAHILRENTGSNHQFPKFGVSQHPSGQDR